MKKKKKVLPLSKKQLSEQIDAWHRFVAMHEKIGKKLIKDSKMCSILLSNSKVFGRFTRHNEEFYHFVCGRKVDASWDSINEAYYSNFDCFGSGKGSFAYEVTNNMTHLSQFLVLLAVFAARRKY